MMPIQMASRYFSASRTDNEPARFGRDGDINPQSDDHLSHAWPIFGRLAQMLQFIVGADLEIVACLCAIVTFCLFCAGAGRKGSTCAPPPAVALPRE
jgi:hypothetical protein